MKLIYIPHCVLCLSFPRKRESSLLGNFWIPGQAGNDIQENIGSNIDEQKIISRNVKCSHGFWRLPGTERNKHQRRLIRSKGESDEKVFKTLKQINADGISTGMKMLDPEFIRRTKEMGLEHHVWTVDQVDLAKKYMEWGTNSITTNIPYEMKKVLLSN